MKKTVFALTLGLVLATNGMLAIAQDAPPSSDSPQTEPAPKQAVEEPTQDPQVEEEKSDEKKSDEKKSDGAPADGQPTEPDAEKSETAEAPPSGGLRRNLFGNGSEDEVAYSKRAGEFVAVFKPLIVSAEASTVKIMSGKRQLALGIVVDADGFILTKASELKGELTCNFPDGRSATATVFGVHPETDLAMLKIDLKNLNPIQWSTEPTPAVGHWLVTPNLQKSTLDVGIVGVNERVIPPSDPFIGIGPAAPGDESAEKVAGAKINMVVAGSPADDADLMVGDLITRIDDVEIIDWPGLQKTLKQYDVDDRITLTLSRAGKEMKIKLTLAERDKISPQNDRSNQQNSMGSILSRRRKDFPNAFQHDSMLNSSSCGGPVINLDGQVVGVNIARAGRVDSLALPVQTVLPIIALLKTGELVPALVNQARLAEIDKELAELTSRMAGLPSKKSALETQFQVEKAKQEELEKILKDVQDRLKVIDLKSKNFGTELDSVKNELKTSEKTRQRLEADRKQLSTGVR